MKNQTCCSFVLVAILATLVSSCHFSQKGGDQSQTIKLSQASTNGATVSGDIRVDTRVKVDPVKVNQVEVAPVVVKPVDINIHSTQHIDSGDVLLKTAKDIPVQLKAPSEPLKVEAPKPFAVKLEPDGTIQADLTVKEIPLKLANENLAATITLKLDPSFKGLAPNTIANTSAPIQSTNLVSTGQFLIPAFSTLGLTILSFLILFSIGLLGRFLSYAFIPGQAKLMSKLHSELIAESLANNDQNRKQNYIAGLVESIFYFDLFSGGSAALLVPAFMRIFPGGSTITTLDATSQAITIASLALLAGMLGVEFIRGLASLVLWLLVSLKKKGTNKGCEERAELLENANKLLKQAPSEIALVKADLKRINRNLEEIEKHLRPPSMNKPSLKL